MGSGASVEVVAPHTSDVHFKTLLSSKEEREKLFDEISKVNADDRINLKGRISLKKLVAYFSDESKALYPGFHVNVDTLNETFKYATKNYKYSTKTKKHEQMNKKEFHIFLPTLFLFVKLWDIFDAADKMLVEDQRVFKGEFMQIKNRFKDINGLVILGSITDEEWAQEYTLLDKNNDGYINFNEACTYAISHIKKPFDYSETTEDDEESDDEKLIEVTGKLEPDQNETLSSAVNNSATSTVADHPTAAVINGLFAVQVQPHTSSNNSDNSSIGLASPSKDGISINSPVSVTKPIPSNKIIYV